MFKCYLYQFFDIPNQKSVKWEKTILSFSFRHPALHFRQQNGQSGQLMMLLCLFDISDGLKAAKKPKSLPFQVFRGSYNRLLMMDGVVFHFEKRDTQDIALKKVFLTNYRCLLDATNQDWREDWGKIHTVRTLKILQSHHNDNNRFPIADIQFLQD